MHATCARTRVSSGWADDWTAALEGGHGGPESDIAKVVLQPSVPVPGTFPACHISNAISNGAPADATWSCDPLVSPQYMHYCLAAERDEWAAVLGARQQLHVSAPDTPFPFPTPQSPPEGPTYETSSVSVLDGAATASSATSAAAIPAVPAAAAAAAVVSPAGPTTANVASAIHPLGQTLVGAEAAEAAAAVGEATAAVGKATAAVGEATAAVAEAAAAVEEAAAAVGEATAAALQPTCHPAAPNVTRQSGGGSCGGEGTLSGAGVVLVAIELGSHCVRAIIHNGVSELERLTYDTMLGQVAAPGGDTGGSGGKLHPGALQRTLEALHGIMAAAVAATSAAAAASHDVRLLRVPESAVETETAAAAAREAFAAPGGVSSVASGPRRVVTRMVATAAVRNASSSSNTALAAAAEQLAGCPLQVLSGEEEGRLAWRGVVGGLQTATPTTAGAADADVTVPIAVVSAAGSLAGVALRGRGVSSVGGVPASLLAQQAPTPPPPQQPPPPPPPQPQQLLVVDMGGRSTEFVYGPAREDRPAVISVPLGCVGLLAAACAASACEPSADHLRSAAPLAALAADQQLAGLQGGGVNCGGDSDGGPCGERAAAAMEPSLEGLQQCIRLSRETVERLCEEAPWLSCHTTPSGLTEAAADTVQSAPQAAYGTALRTAQPPPALTTCSRGQGADAIAVIFTGGTVTTLAALHLQLPYYDRSRVHGCILASYDIAALMERLADARGQATALRSYDWLTATRCRTLAAGCAGLLGVMAALGVYHVRVSDADLLDGLLAEMLQEEITS